MKAKFLYSLILLLIVSSCTKLITIDLPKEPDKICVYSIATVDSIWRARVLSSNPTLGNDNYAYIKNASVGIYENSTKITQLQYDTTGYYISSKNRPQAGHIYTIIVETQGYETIQATDTIPLPVELFNDTIVGPFKDNDNLSYYFYNFTFNPRSAQYIAIENLITSKEKTSDSTFWTENENKMVRYTDDGFQSILAGYFLVFPSSQWIKNQQTLNAYIDPTINTNRYIYYNEYYNLTSYSHAYYQYFKTLADYKKDDIFIEEKAPVYSNIQNGYGIFASKNNGTRKLIIKYQNTSHPIAPLIEKYNPIIETRILKK